MKGITLSFVLLWIISLFVYPLQAQENQGKKALTFQDIMKFREVHSPVLSENGHWLAYEARPGVGDSMTYIHDLENNKEYTVDRGKRPVISKNSKWAAVMVDPESFGITESEKKKKKQGMTLLNLESEASFHYERVKAFLFSDDSRWIAYQHFEEEKEPQKQEVKKPAEEQPKEEKEEEKPAQPQPKLKSGSSLILKNLETGEEIQIPSVLEFAFDKPSRYLAYAVAEESGEENGLYYVSLSREGWSKNSLQKIPKAEFSQLSWSQEGSKLAYLVGPFDEELTAPKCSLWIWDGVTVRLVQAVDLPAVSQGWFIPIKNKIEWSKDGERVFFGLKPDIFLEEKEPEKKDEKIIQAEELYDMDEILEKKEVDVWHWDDPFINSHQKKLWAQLKQRTHDAVYHLGSKKFVQLGDMDMTYIRRNENPDHVLGFSDVPYRKEATWDGSYYDIFLINLKTGDKRKVASRLERQVELSPQGRFVVFYNNKHWHLYDSKNGSVTNLTQDLKVPFYDEDHDYPSAPPGYGIGGWVEKDRAVLIYDKYDIWQFSTQTHKTVNITGGTGRDLDLTFRIIHTDPEQRFFTEKEKLLLLSYHNLKKNNGFYTGQISGKSVEKLLEEKKKFQFLALAKSSSRIMFTQESYEEFPDIWISDPDFASPEKISNVNPQIKDFAWGTAELVEWLSLDGIPLQGVLIKPGNYEPGKRYPVFTYFYRFFSQRLHEFNQIVINHRPCFPFYASHGYAVFLPDIRFDIGNPGYSATKCLVPGIQKLIDIGIADPKAVGLHGHSWSGYQTAFVITQTDIFSAAIAGAPVSNMTSAYSGIRWESGLARQFQYEKSQSRIGGSLWEKPELYIENSPVFYADRIETPLLIMFGDEDGAVPWYQGIELYLAMRRLGKDCVFLQYRGEPHHPQKYANKLDYSIKMKQYFDHYLKGEPAADWIKKGIPYTGK